MSKQNLPYYRSTVEEVLAELESDSKGLSSSQAKKRLEEHGLNTLNVKRKESHIISFLRQFKDLMIVLLLASALLSLYLHDVRTAVVLSVLVFFNTTIGFLQEFKAERIIDSLEKLIVENATVLRDGKEIEVASTELVVGDIVYVEEGASVPADLRIIEEDELSTNDFALTGESNPSRKFTHAIQTEVNLAAQQNQVYMGTTVATGHGYGVVIGTGQRTELGRIASLSQATRAELSPLQKELNNIATRVTQGTVILCAILLPVAIHSGLGIKDAILFAIGIASSIIPQGLPAEINTALAQAANKLARARALVKKLSAVETLGSTSVICTDKTGTLTKNEMTVEDIMIGRIPYHTTRSGYEPSGWLTDGHSKRLTSDQIKTIDLFFRTGVLASNAHVDPPDNEHANWYCIGDPTEGALVTLARKAGIDPVALDQKYKELKEFPFDSGRKRMSSIREVDGQIVAYVKGAPESILACSTKLWDHGHIRTLTANDRKFFGQYNESQAQNAKRNLALAIRILPKGTKIRHHQPELVEQDLVFVGMVSMVDPLRSEVTAAMKTAHAAHIKVSIITGDYAVTAKAIAARAKLTANPDDTIVVSGEELQKLSDAQIAVLVNRGGVIFSRVAPEDKLRIVGLAQTSGDVVAVTGDGINDAPALKKADIGVAMGKTGTDVAKQSAEIILLDDSFHTLVGAVEQGRTIFQNIRKGTLSAFTSNAAELVVNLLSLAVATLFHIPLALSVMEILAIDLIAELFPIAALGWDKADGRVMSDKPRDPHAHILNKQTILDLLWCGVLIGGLAFLNYLWFFERHNVNPENLASSSLLHMQATALTYLTIVLAQLANILQRRSSQGLFTRYQFHNKHLWFAMAFSLFCVVNIIYNPFIAPYFQAGSLGIIDWLTAVLAAAVFILIREFHHLTKKHTRKALVAKHRAHKTLLAAER